MRYFILSFLLCLSVLTYSQDMESYRQSLVESTSKGIMCGHHDDTLVGYNWKSPIGRSDIFDICGKYPAMMGFDMMGIELGRANYATGITYAQIRQEIQKQYARGGYITISWHMFNPSTGGNVWDLTDKQVVTKILTKNSKVRTTFLQYLFRGAEFLKSLKDDQGNLIPVIFRPFHECHNSAMWWGKDFCTESEFKQLWQLTYNYMKSQECTNLLYAYSPTSYVIGRDNYLSRYPGDEYVDILGYEYYQLKDGTVAQKKAKLKEMIGYNLPIVVKIAQEKNKLVAITETGIYINTDSKWWTDTFLPMIKDYPITYFLLWRNANKNEAGECYAPYKGEKSAKNFLKFCNNTKILMCK